MSEFYDTAIRLAEQAGTLTLQYFQANVNVETKDDASPVTIADQKAEELIRNELAHLYPDDGIVGEEHGEEKSKSGRRWIIDPIDGTKSFIRDVPLYGTLIAVEWDNAMQVGVMRFPALGITIAAEVGQGCFQNGKPCRVSNTSTMEEAAFMITSYKDLMHYHGKEVIVRLLKTAQIQRTWGDCYGYNLLATGKADAMMEPVVKIWDVAPLIPIIREAGGKITDVNGNEFENLTSVVASNGIIHDQVVSLFQ